MAFLTTARPHLPPRSPLARPHRARLLALAAPLPLALAAHIVSLMLFWSNSSRIKQVQLWALYAKINTLFSLQSSLYPTRTRSAQRELNVEVQFYWMCERYVRKYMTAVFVWICAHSLQLWQNKYYKTHPASTCQTRVTRLIFLILLFLRLCAVALNVLFTETNLYLAPVTLMRSRSDGQCRPGFGAYWPLILVLLFFKWYFIIFLMVWKRGLLRNRLTKKIAAHEGYIPSQSKYDLVCKKIQQA